MPQITADEIENLRRVFVLYSKLPRNQYKNIEKCEKDFDNNIPLFSKLIKQLWQSSEENKNKC